VIEVKGGDVRGDCGILPGGGGAAKVGCSAGRTGKRGQTMSEPAKKRKENKFLAGKEGKVWGMV